MEMTGSALQEYARGILSHIPWGHWVVMGVVSLTLTVIPLIRKKCSVYGAIALCLTVFMGLFLLVTTVLIRYLGITPHSSGYNLTLEFSRLFQNSGRMHFEIIANIAAFVPFGFFLAEFLATLNRTGSWRRIGLVTLAAFCLSLCIECFQLILRVGFFELTDLVMNTVGAFFGAFLAMIGRSWFESIEEKIR